MVAIGRRYILGRKEQQDQSGDMAEYKNVKKELTKLLTECSMDKYVGLTASVLAENIVDYMGQMKRQIEMNGPSRKPWEWPLEKESKDG